MQANRAVNEEDDAIRWFVNGSGFLENKIGSVDKRRSSGKTLGEG